MIAPKYVERNTGLIRDRGKSLDMHQRRLQEIQSGKSTIDTRPPKSQQVVSCRNNTKNFHNSQNKEAIGRQNQAMLGKLIDINTKKRNHSFAGDSARPNTLNEIQRREANRRIVQENQMIAKRLVDRQPTISTKELEGQYSNTTRYKSNMKKVRNII